MVNQVSAIGMQWVWYDSVVQHYVVKGCHVSSVLASLGLYISMLCLYITMSSRAVVCQCVSAP